MNEQEKKEYLEQYKKEKEHGVPFFPDIIFKDVIIALVIFLLLIGLAYLLGAPLEERANTANTNYTPRPEWYFLFLFQLLKYFPGQFEIVGVVLIPSLAILILFFLPFLDRNTKRHFLDRPVISAITILAVVGIIALTILAVVEAPPPVQASKGDSVALLYTSNCAPCHGASISVPSGTNLHTLIAQGSHTGMPAWSGDLSSDQIDELAGFILSPGGSELFNRNCGSCHKVEDLVGGNPIDVKNTINEGLNFTLHAELEDAAWSTNLSMAEKTSLLNFLIAPDGQRLFTIYCSSCHGQSIAFTGDESTLYETIVKGGQHVTMPAWQNTLSKDKIEILARFVLDPSAVPEGQELFKQNCSSCHGERIPNAADLDQAIQIISTGGPHKTMPVWGNVLTKEQIEALVNFIVSSSQGTSPQAGQTLFAQYCAACHGELGEGGINPVNPNQILNPIGTANFFNTHDDPTLFQIISQGRPDSGMSPFGSANGGNLEDDQINAIVAYLRSWQSNPPVTIPPQYNLPVLTLSASEINLHSCASCHGQNGEGTTIGPGLNDLSDDSDEDIYTVIDRGVPGSTMLSFGSLLSESQINELVAIIRQFPPPQSTVQPTPTVEPVSKIPTFDVDILPIFIKSCTMCHGTMGGWDGTTFMGVMTTGDHAPAIIPGDANNSLLAQKVLGTAAFGGIMHPGGKLPDVTI